MDRRTSLATALALASLLTLGGCLTTAAIIGGIKTLAQGGPGAKAQLRLEMSADDIYDALFELEDEWRDADIVKRNDRQRKVVIKEPKREFEIRVKVRPVLNDLSTVTVVAQAGKLRMTDEEFAVYLLDRLCRELETRCYKIGSDEDPHANKDLVEP